MAAKRIYRIRFMGEGKIYELYAKNVSQGGLFGFIEVSQMVWGKKSEVIIDPSEQELRNEFQGVKCVHLPMHSVVRIDEVEKGGSGKIIAFKGASDAAPSSTVPIYTPSGPKES